MGKTRAERILRAVEGEFWACQPEKLEQLAQILVAKAESGQIPTAQEIEAADAAQRAGTRRTGAVAVIPLYGTISRRMGMLDAMSGGASIESFSEAFRQAVADPEISSILIRIHSPGGSVYGVEEAARMIYDARGKKRVVAIADNLMCSAAYYIAAAAGELVATPSTEGGSIGVYTVHFDFSEAIATEGVKVTIIKAGENKAEGNPYESLSDDARAHTQSIVDAYYSQFIRSVARGRGVPVATVRETFGKGRTYTSERLLSLGMVDRIATYEATVEDLQKGRGQPAARAAYATPNSVVASVESALRAAASEEAPPTPLNAIVARATELFVRSFAQPETVIQTHTPESQPTAEGGEASEHEVAPIQPAPGGQKESPVDAKDTAAPSNGAGSQEVQAAVTADRERGRQIRAICKEHSIDAATADKWVADGVTVDQVNGLVLGELSRRDAAAPAVQVGADREAEKPYPTLGAQLQAIALAGKEGASPEKRLLHLNAQYDRNAAASGANTTVPSDGGFVIQPDFMPGITTKMWDEGRILSRTNRVPIGPNSNGLKRHHIKEHSRVTGSRYGGVRVYRTAEAATVESSKQQIREQEIKLDKLMGLYYATDEILQDAVALTVEAEKGFRSELTFVCENEVFRGTGAGQCLGFLNSAVLVTVLKEGSQAADTILVANVAKMMARLPARSFPTAAWLIHSSVIPQLVQMTIGNQPVFIPGGNIAGGRFGTLFGIPIEPVEYCAKLGDLGDIVLADLNTYTTIDKRGVQWTESAHVRFIYDETAFKLTYRFNGQPDWDSAVTEFQGTDTLSPFIVLEAR